MGHFGQGSSTICAGGARGLSSAEEYKPHLVLGEEALVPKDDLLNDLASTQLVADGSFHLDRLEGRIKVKRRLRRAKD